jgi:hypothetical protein
MFRDSMEWRCSIGFDDGVVSKLHLLLLLYMVREDHGCWERF